MTVDPGVVLGREEEKRNGKKEKNAEHPVPTTPQKGQVYIPMFTLAYWREEFRDRLMPAYMHAHSFDTLHVKVSQVVGQYIHGFCKATKRDKVSE